MREDILDSEEHTGPRTCPNCGHQFPFGDFVRQYAMSYGGLTKWVCHGCRRLITCDYNRLQMFWLIALVPAGILFALLISYIDLDWLNMFFTLPFFGFVLMTLYYAKFERYDESK